jgi:rhodanese-related sulfurtransferase
MNEINLSKLISGILVVAIILVGGYGLLSIDFSAETFQKKPVETHQQLLKNEHFINIEDINLKDSINDFVLVDLRAKTDFDKGHFDNALHIFAPNILESELVAVLKKINNDNKTIVLYSHTPQEANSSWYILNSIGIENLKILNVKTAFVNNIFEVTPFNAEVLKTDIAQYIKERNEVKIAPVNIDSIKKPVQVVKPVKKEKVEIEEGGC